MGVVASVVTVGAAMLVASCGGPARPQSVAHLGKNTPTPTTVAAASSGAFPNLQQLYQQSLAYAGCMRTHGEPNYPDPVLVNNSHEKGVTTPGDVDQNSPQYKAANSACKHLLPNDGGGPTQAQVQQGMATLVKAAECMRSHGVPNFPDPTESHGGKAIGVSIERGRHQHPTVPSRSKGMPVSVAAPWRRLTNRVSLIRPTSRSLSMRRP